MEFYLGEELTPILVEVRPQLIKTKDATNDSFTCTLKANSEKKPIKPMTPLKVVYDDNTTQVFWIINDSVEVFSLNPEAYKHTLSLVQYRYFLNKHLTRNTTFNQPKNSKQKLYCAVTNRLGRRSDGNLNYEGIEAQTGHYMYWGDTTRINYHSKIKSFSYHFRVYGVLNTDSGHGTPSTMEQITSPFTSSDNMQLNGKGKFLILDQNNNIVPNTTIEIDNNIFGGGEIVSENIKNALNEYIKNHRANTKFKIAFVSSETGHSWPIQDFVFVKTINTDPQDEGRLEETTTYVYVTVQIHINIEIYNYTMYDIIDILNEQYILFSNQGLHRQRLFNMPLPETDGLYELLSTTYPPDTMSFTQATFYEALEEIFKFFDAGFKFDENKTLQIDYYNEFHDKNEQRWAGISLSQSDKNYNSGRVAYYQNAIIKSKISRIGVRSEKLGIPEEEDKAVILPKNIYNLDALYIKCDGTFTLPVDANSLIYGVNKTYTLNGWLYIDISQFVLEESVWATLDKDYYDALNLDAQKNIQCNTLYYTRGGNSINIARKYTESDNTSRYVLTNVLARAYDRFFGFDKAVVNVTNKFSGPNVVSYDTMIFSVEFSFLNEGRVQTETIDQKYNGEMLVNQSSGFIDLNKLGYSILSESLKDGEPTMNVSIEIATWESKIKTGDYIILDGEKWIANVLNFEILPNGNQKCNVEFSKNFNALGLRVKTDKEKRLTSISRDIASLSEDNYIEFVYVDDEDGSSMDETVLNDSVLECMVGKTFRISKTYDVDDVELAIFSSKTLRGATIKQNLYIPLAKYGSGNCICFETQFNDPISAGNQLVKSSGWFGTNKWFSQAVLYADEDGWADLVKIDFASININGLRDGIGNFPVVDTTKITKVGTLDNLIFYKKPNEIFALNYEWCFLPLPTKINKFFIGVSFINNNYFVTKDKAENKKFYLRYTTEENDFQYSVMDVKGEGSTDNIASMSISYSIDVVTLSITSTNSFVAKTWAIVDENNNIYLASNKEWDSSSPLTIYFKTSRTRL